MLFQKNPTQGLEKFYFSEGCCLFISSLVVFRSFVSLGYVHMKERADGMLLPPEPSLYIE